MAAPTYEAFRGGEPKADGTFAGDEPVIRLRFVVQILDAKPVDLDAKDAIENIRGNGKGKPAYQVALVAVLPEREAGMLISMAKGHRITVEPVLDDEAVLASL